MESLLDFNRPLEMFLFGLLFDPKVTQFSGCFPYELLDVLALQSKESSFVPMMVDASVGDPT